MRVALVHEFLTQLGGAEKLLEVFHEMFPEAPVYTLFYDRQRTGGRFEGWDIRPSFLQNIPGALAHYKWFLPLMPRAIERFDLTGFDLVLSDSSAFAMGAKKSPNSTHICYCHTPTRYIWENHEEYIANLPYPKIVKMLAHIYIKNHQASWDLATSKRPDFFIANSKTVQDRIKKYYGRNSTVIYPPVDTDFFTIGTGVKQEYFLTGSRLEPYKKIELVVEAFNELGLPLKVVGTGTEAESLKRKAKNNIEFFGRVSDAELRALYQGARAFVFPALEDAGLMTLEALACGTPVIGLARGGTPEFVTDGKNGVLFENQTSEEIIAAVKRFESMSFDADKLRESALPFDKAKFKAHILEFIRTR
ncbi:MAG: hypothetical protein A2846_02505 [Candidatus Doudnabacteria bacterium RIFCSPHIGHO2_01_FULL_49_9]|uniref:Glycosyl transferase family 1 domain-containing protein n=1 Tax=Candidatus Doudnabacteria bacterium RIFCSPHIGHO2_01_FULL_49_9 TaxID=1817827 RepID=A0A1F5P2U2_9BACT|nr:MAG: hypothetical protein A2846_02505 [Candidatus Doudnabacteria bacterium RIFCSPHIGHO2_01_FULL_49_9]